MVKEMFLHQLEQFLIGDCIPCLMSFFCKPSFIVANCTFMFSVSVEMCIALWI